MTLGRTLLSIVCLGLVCGIAAATGNAMTPSQIGRCLDSTGHSAISTTAVLQGIDGLTREQKLELRVRVIRAGAGRGLQIDDLGLTPEQSDTIKKRVATILASWKAHAVGWPCPAFANPTKSIAAVRSTLVYNGFRPAMWIKLVSPRQIAFRAIQDGVTYYGTAVRISNAKIALQLTSTHNGGDSLTFPTGFVP